VFLSVQSDLTIRKSFSTSGFGKRSGLKDEEGCLIFYPPFFTIQRNLEKSLEEERIDRPILDLLKIDPESQFEMTTDGKSNQITPLDAVKAKVRDARAKVNAKHAKAFKKLAE